jgi:2-keto-3-deoxy-L-rhamnonate aldolase RhmA
VPGQFDHPKIIEATKRVAEVAGRYGKHWGRPVGTIDQAQQYLEMNARFITCGADILLVKAGLELLRADFSKLGFSFDNKL